MKTISLWQPYATLMAIGAKRYETRGWFTAYRGPLAIHAAKRPVDLSCFSVEELQMLGQVLSRAGHARSRDLPRGAVVGIVEMVGAYSTESVRRGISLQERAFGNYDDGRFAWQTTNPRRFAEPIPWAGKQGFFDVPDALIRQALAGGAEVSR